VLKKLHFAVLSAVFLPALATASPSVCGAISGNLVANCGFETGDFTSWTESGSLGYNFVAPAASVAPNFANSGNFGAQLGPIGTPGDPTTYGYLSQALATTPGRTYSLTYYLDNPSSDGDNAPSVFQASWNGSVIPGSVQNPVPELDNFVKYTFNGLTASSSSTVLEFGFLQNPAYLGLDDISVVASAASSAAEPGGYFVLLAAGFAAMLFIRYRRAQRIAQRI